MPPYSPPRLESSKCEARSACLHFIHHKLKTPQSNGYNLLACLHCGSTHQGISCNAIEDRNRFKAVTHQTSKVKAKNKLASQVNIYIYRISLHLFYKLMPGWRREVLAAGASMCELPSPTTIVETEAGVIISSDPRRILDCLKGSLWEAVVLLFFLNAPFLKQR